MAASIFLAPPAPPLSTYLSFDFGHRRIGAAVGDMITATGRPLPTLNTVQGGPDWEGISKLIQEWRPAALIVGLPLDESGAEQDITRATREFAASLKNKFKLEVVLTDERFSSRAADDLLRQARQSGRMARRVRKGDRDGESARVILEQWLQSQ